MRVPDVLLSLTIVSSLVAAVSAVPVEEGGAEGGLVPIAVFEVRGGGALYHLEGGTTLGQKAFKNKIKGSAVISCIDGGLGCSGHMDPDELSADGKLYLYIYDETTWGITTTADPVQTIVPVTILRGLMDGKGRFMFAGRHVTSETDLIFEGKAALQKGTLTPKKVNGKLQAVSIQAEHWSKANVKTFGASLFTPGN
jgi:hypothetical protein